MVQFQSLRDLVGQFFSFVRSQFFITVNNDKQYTDINNNQPPEPVIIGPTHETFQQELKLRTEAFDKYTMSETMKDLEKAIYHLSASVSQLKEQGKKNEELLVVLSTTHEELLHTVEDYLTTPTPSATTTKVEEETMAEEDSDEDDDSLLGRAWDNKKGMAGLN